MSSELATHDEVKEATAAVEAEMRPQRVPVNVYETSASLVVVAPLPAVSTDDLSIEIRPGCLRFWAHLRSAAPRDYLVHEWDYGGYERDVDLPDGYGPEFEHSLANGQLVIRVLRSSPDTIG